MEAHVGGAPDPGVTRRARRGPRSASRIAILVAMVATIAAALPGTAAAADPTPTPSPVGAPVQGRSRPAATLAPALTPAPTATPTSSPSATFGSAAATARPVVPAATLAPVPTPARSLQDVLIYRSSAMVKQYTDYWCVPATTQSMVNLILGTSDRTRETQERYYAGTRAHNRYTYSTKGNDPQGWAWALRTYSGGIPYQARSYTNKSTALNAIADAIDRTGHPVGVPVHRGTHAWIVLGYRAQPDPGDPSKRTILGFYVSGPLGSPSDPWPYAYLTNSQFRQHFSMYHEWQRTVIWEGTWVVVSE
jgi:hypothetical protein